MRISRRLSFSAMLISLFFISGCFGPSGYSQTEKRNNVRTIGVFSNVGANIILFSAGSGWGIVRDNQSGKDTYMSMVSAGSGPGLGVKDFRGVLVFTSKDALNNFIQQGWTAQGQADAAAKAGEKGDAVVGAIEIAPGIKLFQMTENGLALQATIQGTKFWKDSELN
jgi:lipid-binding SYLF domain-containing protein